MSSAAGTRKRTRATDVRADMERELIGMPALLTKHGREVLHELARFFALKLAANDVAAKVPRVRPSGAVDAAWHSLMLRPVAYADFCAAHLGQLAYHDPDTARQPERADAYASTLVAYAAAYGEPPAHIWPRASAAQTVYVKTMSGKTETYAVELTKDTVASLKAQIQRTGGVPPAQQRLIYAGKQLVETQTLASASVQHQSTLHLVLKLRGC